MKSRRKPAANGEVMLDVDVTKDSVGTYTADGFTINTKHVKTQVNIDNGGTLVIGGIYQEDTRKTVDKVPFLGDIPLLGNLFKTTNRSTSKTELLIFLTPHILDSRGNILPPGASRGLKLMSKHHKHISKTATTTDNDHKP